MPKSKDAFRTISEVAEWLETPAHVLRFWESKFTQVKPVKRAGGRRYYRPADMQLLGGIKKLLHDDGLTIKGAQKLLREHGVKHVADLSPPLDDDLLDDDHIQEAAFEHDAQPEPLIDEPATVLSFPNRTETAPTATPASQAQPIETPTPAPVTDNVEAAEEATPELPMDAAEPIAEATAESAPTPEQAPMEPTPRAEPVEDAAISPKIETAAQRPAAVDPAAIDPSVADAPAVSETRTPMAPTEDVQPPIVETVAEFEATIDEPPTPAQDKATEAEAEPSFSSDALPAFLRRSAPAKEPAEIAPSAIEPTPPPPPSESAAEKVTINPVAHLEPIEEQEVAPETSSQTTPDDGAIEQSPPQPIFSHRSVNSNEATATPVQAEEAQTLKTTPEPVAPVEQNEPGVAPKVAVDVPSLTKIAPEIDSFVARPGVLAALPGARLLSDELSVAIAPKLVELRALRDRMQNQ